MPTYYFKTFRRNLFRNKTSFLLNLLALVLGIGCFLFTLLFVFYEHGYDRSNSKLDRICRLVSDVHSGGNESKEAVAFGFLREQLRKQFPEIERIGRFDSYDGRTGLRWKPNEALIPVEKLYYADQDVFDIFPYHLLAGNGKTCLQAPNTIVVTSSLALRIFGKTDPMGQTLSLKGRPLKVTGIMADLPGNTDLRFNGLMSAGGLPPEEMQGWMYVYVLFRNAKAMAAFQPKLDGFFKNTLNPEIGADATTQVSGVILPLGSVHFSAYRERDTPKGNAVYVNIFFITGILILLIACTNSINLTIVQSFSRVMDVTIRKIYGASKLRLIWQHVLESLFVGGIAILLSFLLVWLLLPAFALVVDRDLAAYDLFNWRMLGAAIAGLVLLGAGGAVYTGVYLNKVQLADTLRSKNSKIGGLRIVPRLMLGFQFFISTGMLIAAISVYRQVGYFRSAPLGFNPDNVLVVQLPQNALDSAEEVMDRSAKNYLRNTLDHDPDVVLTSFCDATALPGGDADIDVEEYRDHGVKVRKTIYHLDVDAHYFSLLQIPVIQGEGFRDIKDSSARNHALVTTGFAHKAGWTRPIGEVITSQSGPVRVDGVVPEFHFGSLHHIILPLVIFQQTNAQDYLLVRVTPARTATVLKGLEVNWKKAFPDVPFFYTFLDEHLMQQYRDDNNLLDLLLTLTVLMIAISCIGLVAYVSFLLRMAKTSIAIRRVIGAAFKDIYALFARQFVWLLLIGFAVAAPLAWWSSSLWLMQFAYHVDPRPADLGIALAAMGILVGVIVLRYTWQSARVNPGRVLREN
jgi:putative ABC transport system permease protein